MIGLSAAQRMRLDMEKFGLLLIGFVLGIVFLIALEYFAGRR